MTKSAESTEVEDKALLDEEQYFADPLVQKFLKLDFKKFDFDEDLVIERVEFKALIGEIFNVHKPESNPFIDELFDEFDRDNDRACTVKEFYKWRSEVHMAHAYALIHKIVGDADERVKKIDMTKVKTTSEAVDGASDDILGATSVPLQSGDIYDEKEGSVDLELELSEEHADAQAQAGGKGGFKFAHWRAQQSLFWHSKDEEERREMEEEREAAASFKKGFNEQFDLSGGLVVRPASELYDKNYRPFIFVMMNVALCAPSFYWSSWYISAIGILFNGFVLLVGLMAEASFNLAEVFCGECGREWFKYRPGVHYSVLDSWFNIQAFQDKSAGMTLDGDGDDEIQNAETVADFRKAVGMQRNKTLLQMDKEMRQKEIEKLKKRSAEIQIIPPPFSYTCSLGYLIVHGVLLCANAYYTTNFIPPKYKKADRESTWSNYCADKNWDSNKAKNNGECLIRFSGYLCFLSFTAFALFSSVVVMRNIKMKPLIWMRVAKEALLEKFPIDPDNRRRPSARYLLNKIEKRLLTIKAMHHYEYKLELEICCKKRVFQVPYLVFITVLFSMSLVTASIMTKPLWIFSVDYTNVWAFVIFGVAVMQATNSLSQIFFVLWRINNFYRVGYEVMVALVKPLNVEYIEELMIWWEVRKFYQNYNLPVMYVYGAMSLVFVLAVGSGSIAFLTLNILFSSESTGASNFRSPTNTLLSLLIFVLMYAFFTILSNVVSISIIQAKHEHMLRAEKVRLDAYGGLYSLKLREEHIKDQQEMVSAIQEADAQAKRETSVARSTSSRASAMTTARFTALGTGLRYSPLPGGDFGDIDEDDEMMPHTSRATGAASAVSALMAVAAAGSSTADVELSPRSVIGSQRGGTLTVDLTAPSAADLIQSAARLTAMPGKSWMDMKQERLVASVGKDSHRMLESMIFIIENKDLYPKVMGLQITKAKMIALFGYAVASLASVVVKTLVTS
jgi:hypothetical protein